MFPVRTLITRPVPVGTAAVHAAALQLAVLLPSNTRDTKVPAAAYGIRCIQSTLSVLPPAVASLARSCISALMAIGCDATTAPSIEYVSVDAVQWTLKRCGVPIHDPAMGVSRYVNACVRAHSMPPYVPKTANHPPSVVLKPIA